MCLIAIVLVKSIRLDIFFRYCKYFRPTQQTSSRCPSRQWPPGKIKSLDVIQLCFHQLIRLSIYIYAKPSRSAHCFLMSTLLAMLLDLGHKKKGSVHHTLLSFPLCRASATSTSVTVSVVTLGANVDATTRVIINTTAAGVQLGNLPVVSSTVGDTSMLTLLLPLG